MLHAAFQVLLYAFLAGLSPVAFAATISVTPAGRLKSLGFGTAFVVAQLATCSLFVIIGVAATGGSTQSHPDLRAGLELVVAAALIGLAVLVRRRSLAPKEGSSARTRRLLDRLGRLSFGTTLAAGLFLGIGGPKRLGLTALAASTITAAGLNPSGEALLGVLYVAVASVLVWGPVIIYVLLGNSAVARMKRAQKEVARRQPHVTVYTVLLLAALLAADAIGILLL